MISTATLFLVLANPVVHKQIQHTQFLNMFPNWTAAAYFDNHKITHVSLWRSEYSENQIDFLASLPNLQELDLLELSDLTLIKDHANLVQCAKRHVAKRIKGGEASGQVPIKDIFEMLESTDPSIRPTSSLKVRLGPGVVVEDVYLEDCDEMPFIEVINKVCENKGWKMEVEMQGIRITVKRK